MRRLTRALAFGEAWTDEDTRPVTKVVDELAPAWSSRHVDPTTTTHAGTGSWAVVRRCAD